MLIHVTRPGDSLYAVAARYGVAPALLAEMNGLDADARLAVGQALAVRFPKTLHTVAPGESLYALARRYGTEVRTLYRNNLFLGGRPDLRPGDRLVVDFEDDDRLGRAAVNGYAYPYIDRDLLDAALPSLTYLTPFTYGVSRSGGLLPLSDGALLAAAARHRTAALLHLSTLTEEGSFSNERSTLLLGSPDLQEKLIAEVLDTAARKGFAGVDVDFEYVLPAEREAYAAFVERLRRRLNEAGKPVFVALAPKTRPDQPGLLYEAHDYRLLGRAADGVLLMTYEWGYTYGPPMAVAPLPQVRAVLDYAVGVIEPGKILLGVPLYGYDWTLPYVRGESRAESLSPRRAVELALRAGAEIHFDERAMAPWFRYTDRGGREHVVWFEDARSMDARLRLMSEYGLRGAGCWNLMREAPQFWTVLNALYDVETLL